VSILSALLDNQLKSFEQVFNAKDITTAEMREAIKEWYSLYYDRTVTDKEDPCQRIPFVIVNKLYKTTFSEYSAAPAKNAVQSDFIAAVLLGLDKRRKQAVQQALIGGECFLKPLFDPNAKSVRFNVIQRRNYLVLGRNDEDRITDIGLQENTESGGRYFTLLERRTVDANGYLTIINKLFMAADRSTLGVEVPLDTLDKYELLVPEYTFPQPVGSIGLIPVKSPVENCVDGSEDGASVYAPAAGLIHLINTNERQLSGEFERGESRIIASADLLRTGKDGKKRLQDNLFVGLDDDPDSVGVTIFSPEFRDESFLNRKNAYLKAAETMIGLKRGILSEVEAAERTATEVTSSAGDYNLTIQDFQEMWSDAVKEALQTCFTLGQMYKVCSGAAADSEKDLSIDWGNGILYDEDKAWGDYMAMVSAGMLRPEIALAWKFNIPWETPEDLEKIRQKYMPDTTEGDDGGDDE